MRNRCLKSQWTCLHKLACIFYLKNKSDMDRCKKDLSIIDHSSHCLGSDDVWWKQGMGRREELILFCPLYS